MEERPLVVRGKQVFAAAANLHAVASPGPSGFRNSYIQATAEYPGGLEVLRQWCNAVAAGRVQHSTAQLSTAGLVRPFFKGDGVSVRPVERGEALFTFAMAACIGARNGAVYRAYGPCQLEHASATVQGKLSPGLVQQW